MKKISKTSSMSINGGKIFKCLDPNCSMKSENFWAVYWHVLNSGHFKSNAYLSSLYSHGVGCLQKGLELLLLGK